ncbi:MAG TPA: hypothetical protein VGJ21_24180 [Terracidiphilus sp.]|jgi:hypothetical protein
MKSRCVLLLLIILPVGVVTLAQGTSSAGPIADQNPPVQGPPPLAQVKDQRGAEVAPSLSVEAANADLKTARTANHEKRYTDGETLMLRDTAARSNLRLRQRSIPAHRSWFCPPVAPMH